MFRFCNFSCAEFFFVAVLIFIFSCAAPKEQDLSTLTLSTSSFIQTIEKTDHEFCSSLKLEFDKNSNAKSQLYWRCRLSMAKMRNNSERNPDFDDLITKISVKLANTPEANLTKQIKKIDDHHHRQCLAIGFIIETEDQAKIDEYFSCRRVLIEEQKQIPPYGNEQYQKYTNRSYNLSFALDRRIEIELQRYRETKEKYPTCIKFNLRGPDFKNCTKAQDKARVCLAGIEHKKFKKESQQKVICQKKSYINFPDNFLKEDARSSEINRKNTTSDFYNKRSLAAIGASEDTFYSGEKIVKSDEEKKQERNQEINSKHGLYSKFELTKLRQKFISNCIDDSDEALASYVRDLTTNCDELAKFELIGAVE